MHISNVFSVQRLDHYPLYLIKPLKVTFNVSSIDA